MKCSEHGELADGDRHCPDSFRARVNLFGIQSLVLTPTVGTYLQRTEPTTRPGRAGSRVVKNWNPTLVALQMDQAEMNDYRYCCATETLED